MRRLHCLGPEQIMCVRPVEEIRLKRRRAERKLWGYRPGLRIKAGRCPSPWETGPPEPL